MKSPRRIAAIVLAVAAIPYLMVTAYMYVFQRDIMYNPLGDAAPVLNGDMAGVTVETLPMRDGTGLPPGASSRQLPAPDRSLFPWQFR